MARALWIGSINFGLVTIPVSLQPAEEAREELKFSYVDRRDLSPAGYERVSQASGKEVPWDQVGKSIQKTQEKSQKARGAGRSPAKARRSRSA
jgi:DNA end-binding protein Ku